MLAVWIYLITKLTNISERQVTHRWIFFTPDKQMASLSTGHLSVLPWMEILLNLVFVVFQADATSNVCRGAHARNSSESWNSLKKRLTKIAFLSGDSNFLAYFPNLSHCNIVVCQMQYIVHTPTLGRFWSQDPFGSSMIRSSSSDSNNSSEVLVPVVKCIIMI